VTVFLALSPITAAWLGALLLVENDHRHLCASSRPRRRRPLVRLPGRARI